MIKSVQKATKLLTILADNYNEPLSLAKLSELAEINKATCSHIISTLENEGFVIKISRSKGYILGPAAYCLSRFGRYNEKLIAVCHPFMQYLYRSLGHAIILAVIEKDKKYIIDYIDDGRMFETKTKIRTDDIYRTATGRAILANLSSDKSYAIFKRYGFPSEKDWTNITSYNDMIADLSKNDKKSVFKTETINEQSNTVDLGYGIALFNATCCIGALGVAVRLPIDNREKFQKDEENIKKLIKQCAKEISCRLSDL